MLKGKREVISLLMWWVTMI